MTLRKTKRMALAVRSTRADAKAALKDWVRADDSALRSECRFHSLANAAIATKNPFSDYSRLRAAAEAWHTTVKEAYQLRKDAAAACRYQTAKIRLAVARLDFAIERADNR
jgi:hypothetical protein